MSIKESSAAGTRLPQPEEQDIELLTVLSALADPVRLSLLAELYAGGDGVMDCGTMAVKQPISAPTASHHFRVLRESGLTTTYVVGRRREIELRRDALERRFPGLIDSVLQQAR